MDITLEQLRGARGAPVYDSAGQKIGKVEEIHLDDDTNAPEWIGLGTGVFKTKRVLVPVAGADISSDAVRVPYSKDAVKETPDIDTDEIPQETERELYDHYGIDYSKEPSSTQLPEGPPSGGGTTGGETFIRSEEEFQAGKRRVDAGTVRLRKWVETEPVTAEVETRRETARVEREPIDEPVGDASIGEEQVEVPLDAEEPVVGKQTVAKERVSIGREVETRTETVGDEVRKERIDVEGDVDQR